MEETCEILVFGFENLKVQSQFIVLDSYSANVRWGRGMIRNIEAVKL